MFFPDVVGGIQDVLADIGDADIVIDQAAIDTVLSTLQSKHEDLSGSPFPNLHVPATAFGAAGTAGELGGQHALAHQVINETLQGVLDDLIRFRDGLKHAEKLVHEADTQSAADFDKKRAAAADILVKASRHSEGDVRNHEARNHYLRNHGSDGA
ncbi:MAG: hypothetical protein JWN22_3130 [Nocardioides sp.]|nr:hypothetical protein [Nocardioides sp.]